MTPVDFQEAASIIGRLQGIAAALDDASAKSGQASQSAEFLRHIAARLMDNLSNNEEAVELANGLIPGLYDAVVGGKYTRLMDLLSGFLRSNTDADLKDVSNERDELDEKVLHLRHLLAERDETIEALERQVESLDAALAKFNALDLPEPCDCACGYDDYPIPEEAITPEEEARLERCYTREEVRQVALRTFCFAKDTNAHGTPYEAIDRYISALDN